MLIELKEVSFAYTKKNNVLSKLSIQVPKGAIYGFLGPNGAGKSTVMRLITGVLEDYDGIINLFNDELKNQLPKVFNKIGALVESPALYLHLSGIDNLKCVATLKNIPKSKIYEVLEIVGLKENGLQKVNKYSLGMKQRLAIAMTLLGDPELLLLDEPVNGLDPSGINDIRELLVKLNKEKGITIFISSHLLSEIEKMCTHIAIINNGTLQFEGTMDELSNLNNGINIQVSTKNLTNHFELLKSKFTTLKTITENKFTITLNNQIEIPDFVKYMVNNNIPLYELRMEDSLEEWFFSLTK